MGQISMRSLTVAAAQLGPIARTDTRRQVVERLIAHLKNAAKMGCELVVFPELALTTFFPRWYIEDQAEIDRYFETEMPGPFSTKRAGSGSDSIWVTPSFAAKMAR